MQKPYTLIIPSWYPTGQQPLNGIFIEKHVTAISGFSNVVVMYINEAENEAVLEEKISDTYIRYTYTYARSSSRAINQLKYIRSQKKAYDYIVGKYGKPTMLHLQVVFPAGIFVYLLLLFSSIPLIITEHWSGYTDEDGRYQRLSSILKYLIKGLFKKAKKVSAVSQYLKDAIVRQNLTTADKVSIVSNILNTPDKQETPINTPSTKALYIGNLNDHEKNISMLIEAIGLIVKKHPDFELTLIGGGPESQRFIDLAASKGLLNKNIWFKGYVPNSELGRFYGENSFFILTSNFETFNIAAAEALLYGLPVVSTMCGGPSEYINRQTGIWIRENSPHGIAAAIIEMIEHRGTFGSKAIAAAMSTRYGYDTIVTQLKNLYNINTN
jgi:glycosyltransferase involved in cell wall biosynthesis